MARVSLQFVVVGGSIAGLAAAYALSNAGHNVLVLEESDGKSKSKGGLQSPPNMTKILHRWGLESVLERYAYDCKYWSFYNGNSGKKMGTMTFDEAFMQDLLAGFLFIQHQDLKDILFGMAVKAGASIAYETKVVEVLRSANSATVRLDTGESISADIVIAADGVASPLRPLVTGVSSEEEMDRTTKHLSITFLLSVEEINRHEELRIFTDPTEWHVWFGSGLVVDTNLTENGTLMTATITYSYDRDVPPEDQVWAERPLDYWKIDIEKFEPRARKMLRMAKTVWSRVFFTWECPDDLVCDQSKVVLVGEAAHPMQPGGNHRTAAIIEDAETLGQLFSRINYREQASHFLTAYEEIRLHRAQSQHKQDRALHAMMRTPGPSPEQDARDELLRSTMVYGDWDHMDEPLFRAVWGDEVTLFAHDATEKVDDWWSHWGNLINKRQRKSSKN